MPTRYVAFLRAINVGGHVVKMDALRALFESMRLSHVKTFIASGNVIFDSSAQPQNLEKKIEKQLLKDLGYRVATFLRSIDELNEIAVRQSFDPLELESGGTLFLGFLKIQPPRETFARVLALSNSVDELRVIGREIYWLRRANPGESRLSGSVIEKSIKGEATLRNINTVRQIAERFRR